jgi:hypothetical protein
MLSTQITLLDLMGEKSADGGKTSADAGDSQLLNVERLTCISAENQHAELHRPF